MLGYKILFSDSIKISIDISDSTDIIEAVSNNDRFPGDNQFASDAKEILENEFGFIIVPDKAGNLFDISSDGESISIYFNTIFDFINSSKIAKEYGFSNVFKDEKVGIFCAIELRISNHMLDASRDTSMKLETPDEYAERQASYTAKRDSKVKYISDKQPSIVINKRTLYIDYQEGLDILRNELAQHIRRWSITIHSKREEGVWEGKVSLE